MRFYLNGQLSGDFTMMVSPNFGTPGFLFMMCHNHVGNECSAFPLVGTIDDVGIWSRPLTQAEVQAVMAAPIPVQDRAGDACDACPGNPDRSCAPTTCLDKDGDGYGLQGASACSAGQPAVFDCNDANPNVHKGAVESCDGVDNNCDGRVDESCLQSPQVTVYSYNAFNQLLAAGPPRICPSNDVDCDGVLDTADNCPFIANADQANSDANLPNANGAGARALWGFNEGTGTALADTNGTYNGSFVGSPAWVPGFSGKALNFGGTFGNHVLQTTLTGPVAPFTIEAKVKLTSRSGHLLRWGNLGPRWELSGTGHSVALQSAFGNIPTGQWAHLAFSYDGTTSRYYVDGVQVGSLNQAPWNSGELPLKIGDGLAGAMDEAAVWARVLTPAEVQAHRQGLFGDTLGDACDPCKNNPDPSCQPTTCADADGDGYGVQGASACAGGVEKFDCNDGNGATHPGVRDVCDGVDNDCDGQADEDCPQGGTTFGYDRNGNQVTKQEGTAITEYIFDERNRLTEIKGGAVTLARYGYDTQNHRVSLREGTNEKMVLLDGVEELSEYTLGEPSSIARFDHDPSRYDELLGQVDDSKTHATSDALGSVYSLIDGAGVARARYSYDSFGMRTEIVDTVATNWGFTGRRHGAAGLTYYRARYYDSGVGRFVQRDARLVLDADNYYQYVEGKPTNAVDPSGYVIRYRDGGPSFDLLRKLRKYPTGQQIYNLADNSAQIISIGISGGWRELVNDLEIVAPAAARIIERGGDAKGRIRGGFTFPLPALCSDSEPVRKRWEIGIWMFPRIFTQGEFPFLDPTRPNSFARQGKIAISVVQLLAHEFGHALGMANYLDRNPAASWRDLVEMSSTTTARACQYGRQLNEEIFGPGHYEYRAPDGSRYGGCNH